MTLIANHSPYAQSMDSNQSSGVEPLLQFQSPEAFRPEEDFSLNL